MTGTSCNSSLRGGPILCQPRPVTSASPGLTLSKHTVRHCHQRLSRDLGVGILHHNLLHCPRSPIPAHCYSLARSSASLSGGSTALRAGLGPEHSRAQENKAWSPDSRPHTTFRPLALVQPGCTLNFLMPASLTPCFQLDPGLRSDPIQNLINKKKGRSLAPLGVGRGLGELEAGQGGSGLRGWAHRA